MKNHSKILLIPLLLTMMIAGCGQKIGITSPEAVTFPTVSSTDPVNDATYVILTTVTFTLMRGTTPIPGTVSCSGTTATFTPDSILGHYTTYTARISTGVKNLAGHALADNYVWTFTTGGPLLGGGLCKVQCHQG